EAGFYSDKLAELVARNIRKDKKWVLANTNPKTITFGMPGDSPEGWEGVVTGEGAPEQHFTKYDTVLPYFIYNKELIKVDRDAYNRNHGIKSDRSEEHTSELQSRFDLVCRLLLEKKKKKNKSQTTQSEDIPQKQIAEMNYHDVDDGKKKKRARGESRIDEAGDAEEGSLHGVRVEC